MKNKFPLFALGLVSALSALAAPDSDFDYDVLAPGNHVTVVCSNRDWRVAVYTNGAPGGVEVVMDYANKTIAQNSGLYSAQMGKREASYRIDMGMGNMIQIHFPNRITGRGRANFQDFGAYDIPMLSCEVTD